MMAVTHPLVPIVNCMRKGDLQYPGHHQGRLTLAAAMRPKASKSTRRGYPQASTNRNDPGLEAHPGQPARGGGCGAVLRVLLTGQQTVSSNPARGLASHYRPCPTTTSLSRADAVRSKAVEDRVNWCGRHGIQRGQGLKTLSFTPQQRRSPPCLVFSVATVSAGAPDSGTACHLCMDGRPA